METKAKSEWARRCAALSLAALNIGVGAYVVIVVLPVFYRRLTFPGILQHQESMTIFLLHRMSQGVANLYQMPSLDTGSVIYNPAYYFYLWALHPIIGNHSAPIRIASVVPPLLLCTVLIEIIGRKQMQVRWLGAAWALVSLAIYPLVTWIDLARLEAMLLLSIVLVWFALCLDDNWRPKWMLIGLAVAFSFAVKQPGALFVAAPLALALADRRYLISVGVALAAITLFVGAMYSLYGEPYVYWVFTDPGRHKFWFSKAAGHLQEIVAVAPLILVGPVLSLVQGFDFRTSEGKLFLITVLTFVISALGSGKDGGSVAQYVIVLCLSAIPAAQCLLRARQAPDWPHLRFSLAVLAILAYSIAMTEANDIRRQVRPRRVDRQQQAALLEVVHSVPGKTWVSTWPHIDLWARGQMNASILLQEHELARTDTENAIRNREFALIVITPELDTPFEHLVRQHYVHCCSLPMRHFRARMFLPTEVWARSAEERELVLKAAQK